MSFAMDFLPASYRHAQARRVQVRWSTLLVILVLSGVVATEVVLRTRAAGLRGTRDDARQQADSVALRSSQVQQLQRRQQAALEELEGWSAPLRATRASVVLDRLLSARPPSVAFGVIEWDAGSLADESTQSSLRISGETEALDELSGFLSTLEAGGDVPRLELRRSARRATTSEDSSQEFVLESITEREARP